MKHPIALILLAAEAAACVSLCLARASLAGLFSSVMAFPFEQIGLGLRALSLSGGLGNALALALYALLCLSPALSLLFISKKRRLFPEDWLLAPLCALLFAVIYLMVNPALFSSFMPMGGDIGKALAGCTVYSAVCCYFVLRALRLFYNGGLRELERYMSAMLWIMSAVFVYLVFGACFGELAGSLASLMENGDGGQSLGLSYAFCGLGFMVSALPYALDVFVVFAALDLLEETRVDRYSDAAVAAAGRLSRLCAAALAAAMLSNAAFNVLQFVFAGSLASVNTAVRIPVFSVMFVLAALLLARFLAENKRLKDENDQFI